LRYLPGKLALLWNLLREDGLIEPRGGAHALTGKGLLAAEALGARGSGSQGFVAMWFDDSMKDAWTNGFYPEYAPRDFGQCASIMRTTSAGIADEVMAQIRRSRFLVADYTGQRNSVYFEAGFALGLELTVIPTCRADDVPNLYFDVRHLHTLAWNTPAELADGLNRRIRAVIGAGPDGLRSGMKSKPWPTDDARCRRRGRSAPARIGARHTAIWTKRDQ
jgi:hypothetical protein